MATMKATKFRFVLTSSDDPLEVMSRFHPNSETLLNRTEWRGKPPRSCAITEVKSQPRTGATKGPVAWDIKVTYRPKRYVSYVDATKYY